MGPRQKNRLEEEEHRLCNADKPRLQPAGIEWTLSFNERAWLSPDSSPRGLSGIHYPSTISIMCVF
jgi:hypothetical protein